MSAQENKDLIHEVIEVIFNNFDLDRLEVTGDPDMSVFQFSSATNDINAIGDVMDDRGWHLDRQQGGLHVMVFPGHDAVVEEFLTDLAGAVVVVRRPLVPSLLAALEASDAVVIDLEDAAEGAVDDILSELDVRG